MNRLRCEANENANVALSIAASSSLGASYQERAGEVKASSLEYRRRANSELWKISHDLFGESWTISEAWDASSYYSSNCISG
ncbi:hypothetical protein TNCT_138881 [Trichonephila clavata]|uniref:Uncharacterized protein n=1 Tax=Trichonephila clavata TaxID=2740835 RepID=A0A8X6IZC3_TRICU|nr:hypothetical protein TNCT_138881 [Trichonephila clavata]